MQFERTIEPPILIAGPTRCGTTMIAWLLHLHGAWIGEARVTKAPETNPLVGTENIKLKEYLKTVNSITPNFKEEITKRVHTEGPWLLKTAANLTNQDAWLKYFPDARWVLPFRPIEDIINSAMRHPGFKKAGRERRKQIAETHIRLQEKLADKTENHLWVDVNAMAKKNEDVAREMVEFCGFEFDADIFNNWIQPERWHGT